MDVFIGIDPSLNSTGICIIKYENDQLINKYFAIIKPNKLTKKEMIAQDTYLFFDYVLFDKIDLKNILDNHIHEDTKTNNLINSMERIIDIIRENTTELDKIFIVQEGISYGSTLKTKSIFDLAGLNYMIRYRLKKFIDKRFIYSNYIIATPTEIKKFATGSGNCKKDIIVNNFKILFPDFDLPKIDDICDAYYMALYAKFLKDEEDA